MGPVDERQDQEEQPDKTPNQFVLCVWPLFPALPNGPHLFHRIRRRWFLLVQRHVCQHGRQPSPKIQIAIMMATAFRPFDCSTTAVTRASRAPPSPTHSVKNLTSMCPKLSRPCSSGCTAYESTSRIRLASRRWYPSSARLVSVVGLVMSYPFEQFSSSDFVLFFQTQPDGSLFITSGTSHFIVYALRR